MTTNLERVDQIVQALVLLGATGPVKAEAVLDALQKTGSDLTRPELVEIVDRLRELHRPPTAPACRT